MVHDASSESLRIDDFHPGWCILMHALLPRVKRWYYLARDNPRILLITIGRPLEEWMGEAKIIVGTAEIIGEFAGNREFVGLKGLRLQMQPIAWLQGNADNVFSTGSDLFAAISEQVLDRVAIDRSQREIQQKYQYRK